jgi:putative membrane protein
MSLPDTFMVGVLGSIIFGTLGLALLLLGYTCFKWVTPKLDVENELAKGNIAVAITCAALFFGIAYIVAHVVH